MAWSHLQSVGGNSAAAATIAVTFTTANLSSGSKLIAFVTLNASGVQPTTSSVDDGNGNSFTKLDGFQLSGGIPMENSIWMLDTPSGDVGTKPTITAHCTNTGTSAGLAIVVQEVSGLLAGTSCLDGTVSHTSNTNTCPAYTSTAANEYLTQFYGDDGNSISLTNSGYTIDTAGGANGNADLGVGYKNSTNGSETGTWNGGTPDILTTVAFKLAAVTSASPIAYVPSRAFRVNRVSMGGPLFRPQITLGDQTVATAQNANPTAGVANVNVAALQPTAAVTGIDQTGAAVTVTALAPTPAVTALPTAAPVTVVALAPASTPIVFTAGVANVTVAALAPTPQVTALPTTAPVNVAALAPTLTISSLAVPGVANVNVQAYNPTPRVAALPSTANVVVTALAPTVTITGAPSVANVTVAGLAPTPQVTALPSTAPVNVAAYNPSVTAGGNATANAGLANVTVAALAPTPLVTVLPGRGAVTVVAFAPTAAVTAAPPAANVTVTALAPSVTTTGNVTVIPGTAAVTVTALAPSVVIQLPVQGPTTVHLNPGPPFPEVNRLAVLNISNGDGTSLPGPWTVYRQGTTILATLFADQAMTVPMLNPIIPDGTDYARFSAVDGAYDVVAPVFFNVIYVATVQIVSGPPRTYKAPPVGKYWPVPDSGPGNPWLPE